MVQSKENYQPDKGVNAWKKYFKESLKWAKNHSAFPSWAIFAWLLDVMPSCFSQSRPGFEQLLVFTLSCYWLMIGPWDFLGFGFCNTRSKTAPRELTSVYEHQTIRKTVTPRDRMFSVTGYWPTCWRFMHNNWLLTFYTCGGDRLSVWK